LQDLLSFGKVRIIKVFLWKSRHLVGRSVL